MKRQDWSKAAELGSEHAEEMLEEHCIVTIGVLWYYYEITLVILWEYSGNVVGKLW